MGGAIGTDQYLMLAIVLWVERMDLIAEEQRENLWKIPTAPQDRPFH